MKPRIRCAGDRYSFKAYPDRIIERLAILREVRKLPPDMSYWTESFDEHTDINIRVVQ